MFMFTPPAHPRNFQGGGREGGTSRSETQGTRVPVFLFLFRPPAPYCVESGLGWVVVVVR